MKDDESSDLVPLFVDLDKSLVRTDMSFESLILFLKKNPLHFILSPSWLLKGKSSVKKHLAENTEIYPENLPYNEEFLSFLREEHARGRPLYLATASDRSIAEPIAAHLGIFTDIIANDGAENLRGSNKLEAIRSKIGDTPFDYAGDHITDIPIWKAARKSIVVSDSNRQLAKIKRDISVERTFIQEYDLGAKLCKTLRVHQYSKNMLLFVPLIMAHQVGQWERLANVTLGFFSFCLLASAVYLLNDCIDIQADRLHPSKKDRPIPSGVFPVAHALLFIPLLALSAFVLASLVGKLFVFTCMLYLLLTTAYSFYVKRVEIADVILLSSLYTLRIIAGGVAANVIVSEWLLGFAVFFFLSLAFAKRYAELFRLAEERKVSVKGRGYLPQDLAPLATFGTASGYISVTIFALYINSDHMRELYSQSDALWLICPLLLYWISRIWLLAYRGKMLEDPLMFALTDKVSYAIGILTAFFLFLAK